MKKNLLLFLAMLTALIVYIFIQSTESPDINENFDIENLENENWDDL
tara:strand:+ start:508 stop:648 length:141 start_codon:yes stop_codon:yes gene_type:complete